MTLKLNHLHLKTKDPEKTVRFYVDNLGAKIVNQSPRGGYRLDLHGLSLNVTQFLDDQKREQKYGMEHIARPCLNDRHVCDGGDVGCSSRRRARSNMSILQGFPTKKCAQSAPSLRVVARTGVCFVARLDHIDIWPAPCASHPSRPGHNASRAYY